MQDKLVLVAQSHSHAQRRQKHSHKMWKGKVGKYGGAVLLGLEKVKEDKEVFTAPPGDQTRMGGIRSEDTMEGGACWMFPEMTEAEMV